MAQLVGGVKLKVSEQDFQAGKEILENLKTEDDEDENNPFTNAMLEEFEIYDKALKVKSDYRKNPNKVDQNILIDEDGLNQESIKLVLLEEKAFLEQKRISYKITWKNFWFELFDPDRNFFSYLRKNRSSAFYLHQELVGNFEKKDHKDSEYRCPFCNSEDIYFGHAIDHKWDIPYLILSLVITFPLPPFRKKISLLPMWSRFYH